MSNNYKAKVNNSIEIDINEADVKKLDILSTSLSKHHVLNNNKSFHTEIVSSDFNDKSYRVKVNSNIYDITIANELDQMITNMGFSIGASKQVNTIKSPMPGLIIDIQVETGQFVKQDDYLLILEAMKMENIITSPREGTIKSINVVIGEAVDKGKLLLEFE